MVKCRTTAKGIVAIRALIIPGEVDLITGRAARDQFGFINVRLVHSDLRARGQSESQGRGGRLRCG